MNEKEGASGEDTFYTLSFYTAMCYNASESKTQAIVTCHGNGRNRDQLTQDVIVTLGTISSRGQVLPRVN